MQNTLLCMSVLSMCACVYVFGVVYECTLGKQSSTYCSLKFMQAKNLQIYRLKVKQTQKLQRNAQKQTTILRKRALYKTLIT